MKTIYGDSKKYYKYVKKVSKLQKEDMKTPVSSKDECKKGCEFCKLINRSHELAKKELAKHILNPLFHRITHYNSFKERADIGDREELLWSEGIKEGKRQERAEILNKWEQAITYSEVGRTNIQLLDKEIMLNHFNEAKLSNPAKEDI